MPYAYEIDRFWKKRLSRPHLAIKSIEIIDNTWRDESGLSATELVREFFSKDDSSFSDKLLKTESKEVEVDE